MKKRIGKVFFIVLAIMALAVVFAPSIYAADAGNVSSAIKDTWTSAASQIKTVVNDVVFPIVDCVLAILLFVKLAMSYFEYKKHGEFEFTGAAILFFGLIFAMTAPLYIWNIIGL